MKTLLICLASVLCCGCGTRPGDQGTLHAQVDLSKDYRIYSGMLAKKLEISRPKETPSGWAVAGGAVLAVVIVALIAVTGGSGFNSSSGSVQLSFVNEDVPNKAFEVPLHYGQNDWSEKVTSGKYSVYSVVDGEAFFLGTVKVPSNGSVNLEVRLDAPKFQVRD